MKDFENWNAIKIKTDNRISRIKVHEGEVYWCRFGINIGGEIIGKGKYFLRPVLVLKKYTGNVFLGVPLTSQSKKGDWYFSIEIKGSQTTFVLNQARPLDKKRLQEKMFQISEDKLKKIKEAYCRIILP